MVAYVVSVLLYTVFLTASEMCPVCRDDFEKQSMVTIACRQKIRRGSFRTFSHSLCGDCFKTVIGANIAPVCPTCRTPIVRDAVYPPGRGPFQEPYPWDGLGMMLSREEAARIMFPHEQENSVDYGENPGSLMHPGNVDFVYDVIDEFVGSGIRASILVTSAIVHVSVQALQSVTRVTGVLVGYPLRTLQTLAHGATAENGELLYFHEEASRIGRRRQRDCFSRIME